MFGELQRLLRHFFPPAVNLRELMSSEYQFKRMP